MRVYWAWVIVNPWAPQCLVSRAAAIQLLKTVSHNFDFDSTFLSSLVFPILLTVFYRVVMLLGSSEA